MANWTIMPAPSRPEKCPEADWKQIVRGGEKVVPAVTAKEAIRNSSGGYVIKPKAVAVEVQTGIDLEVANMSNEQLKTIVLMSGKRIGAKKVQRKDLIALARRCIEESATVDDDEEVDSGEGDAAE